MCIFKIIFYWRVWYGAFKNFEFENLFKPWDVGIFEKNAIIKSLISLEGCINLSSIISMVACIKILNFLNMKYYNNLKNIKDCMHPKSSLIKMNLTSCEIFHEIWEDFEIFRFLEVIVLSNFIWLKKIYAKFDNKKSFAITLV